MFKMDLYNKFPERHRHINRRQGTISVIIIFVLIALHHDFHITPYLQLHPKLLNLRRHSRHAVGYGAGIANQPFSAAFKQGHLVLPDFK